MSQVTKILSFVFRSGLAIGLIAYLIFSGAIDWSFVPGLIRSWPFTLLACCGFFIVMMLMALRLQVLIHAHGLVLPYFSSFRLTFIGQFFNTYLPGANGGDLVKIYYASKGNPGRRTEIITIFVFDRIIGMFSLFCMPLLLAPFFYSTIQSSTVLQGLMSITLVVSLGMIVCTILSMIMDVERGRFFVWLYNFLPKGEIIKRILLTMHSYRKNSKSVLYAAFLSLLTQSVAIVAMLLLAKAAIVTGADTRMSLLIPMGFLATALPVTPGGIGVGEAALDGLFKLFSLQGGAELLLGWRLLMVFIGIIGLYYYLKGEQRFVHHANDDDEQPIKSS